MRASWPHWSSPSGWSPDHPPGVLAGPRLPLGPLGPDGWGRAGGGAGRDGDRAGQTMPGASWSLGVRGSRNLQGRKRRLKIIRKGRVRREELGNGGRRAGWSREIVMHPWLPRLGPHACAHGGPGAPLQTAPSTRTPRAPHLAPCARPAAAARPRLSAQSRALSAPLTAALQMAHSRTHEHTHSHTRVTHTHTRITHTHAHT